MKVIDYCPICNSSNLEAGPGTLAPFVAHRIFGWTPIVMQFDNGKNMLSWPICKSLKCRQCSFVFCDMRFDDEEMARLYKDYRGEDYVSLRESYEPGYSRLNNELEGEVINYFDKVESFILASSPRPIHILDWGGNNGINTPFKDAMIDIYDITDKPLLFGLRVVRPKPPYDLIVCSNVLEHVSYPIELLKVIRDYMDNDTALYIEVPKENPEYAAWHEHINRFKEQSLIKLIEVCELDLLDLEVIPPPKHGYEALILAMCKVKV